jgi:hypothetical protein
MVTPKKRRWVALDRGTYLAENNIRDDELIFMVEFIKEHKKVIIKRVLATKLI